MKIRDLLTDKTKWTQGTSARDKHGMELCDSNSSEAVCWCLYGAAVRCYKIESEIVRIHTMMLMALGKDGTCVGVGVWNDDTKRTFAEVKMLVDELDV